MHVTTDLTVACVCVIKDSLFGEMYSGGRVPVSPVAFLSTWWHTAGGHLEGYQQQDAHEFYLNALSGLVRHHQHVIVAVGPSPRFCCSPEFT